MVCAMRRFCSGVSGDGSILSQTTAAASGFLFFLGHDFVAELNLSRKRRERVDRRSDRPAANLKGALHHRGVVRSSRWRGTGRQCERQYQMRLSARGGHVGRSGARQRARVAIVLKRAQLPIKRRDRHLADNIVRLCLVCPVHDISFPFVSEHRVRCGRPVCPVLGNGRGIQQVQRPLNLGDVVPLRAKRDVIGIGHGGGF